MAKTWTLEDEDHLLEMYEGENLSVDIIAKKLGRSVKAINSRVYRMALLRNPGLPPSMKTGSKWTGEELSLLQSLKASGLSLESIARRLRRPVKAIDSKLHHAKLR